MINKLMMNDLKDNKLAAAATCIFMAFSSMLLGLSVLLFASLAGSIDSLMTEAGTPDFLQMHTGTVDESALSGFAEQQKEVEAFQVCSFLNLPNSQLSIGGQSFADNMQDNGLCCQSSSFDYLVDADNAILVPSAGEVFIPVCYREEYRLKEGDVMRIGTEELTVAGFLRDSQMNSMMASSKRFLVSEPDYERLKHLGSEEYLIEFLLREGCDRNAFATAYKEAGLPDNGPTITWPLIRMMNALSDGMMILVILLISLVVLFISMLCIRYMLLTQMEKDKREIGMLKAVGIPKKDIRSLYFAKYLLLSACGCFAGSLAAAVLAVPLGRQMRELYGTSGNMIRVYLFMILGSLAAEAVILMSVRRTLKKTEKMSAVEALFGQGAFGKKKNLWLPVGIITAAAVFMILVPWNLKSTIAAPEFVTYMGIGESQIRMDIRQTDHVERTAKKITEDLQSDARVKDSVLMETGAYKTVLPEGTVCSLLIENGDHSKYPVRYISGKYPEKSNEIALSILNADEMDLQLGDCVRVVQENGEGQAETVSCTVCGIYSDITNGGKTAKACFRDEKDRTPVMWSILYLSLQDEHLVNDWTGEYRDRYAAEDEGVRITVITEYLNGTYGQTIRNIAKASAVSAVLAALVLFVVILLLLRLVIWRERSDSSLKKALGFTSADIKKEYLKKALLYIVPGMVFGIFAGIVPGQSLAGMFLRFMGAYGFQFIIQPVPVVVLTVSVIAVSALPAALLSLREVDRIRAYECFGADFANRG